jgi:hypothetical protein
MELHGTIYAFKLVMGGLSSKVGPLGMLGQHLPSFASFATWPVPPVKTSILP